MNIEVNKISSSMCNISKWSGGTTTELSIYPEYSKYSERNFLYRISTATCDDEKSVFTNLDNIKRELMILDGKVKLEHEKHYTKELTSYEKDSFSGDWKTISYGQCVDFNLMMSENCIGNLESIHITNDKKIIIDKSSEFTNVHFGIYVYKGSLEMNFSNEKINVNDKELVMIKVSEVDKNLELNIKSEVEMDAVLIKVYC